MLFCGYYLVYFAYFDLIIYLLFFFFYGIPEGREGLLGAQKIYEAICLFG